MSQTNISMCLCSHWHKRYLSLIQSAISAAPLELTSAGNTWRGLTRAAFRKGLDTESLGHSRSLTPTDPSGGMWLPEERWGQGGQRRCPQGTAVSAAGQGLGQWAPVPKGLHPLPLSSDVMPFASAALDRTLTQPREPDIPQTGINTVLF